MKGKGHYNLLANLLIDGLSAEAVILIVVNGSRGNGFDVVAKNAVTSLKLPALLRQVADRLEKTREHISDTEAL